jgi:hypothetical protein
MGMDRASQRRIIFVNATQQERKAIASRELHVVHKATSPSITPREAIGLKSYIALHHEYLEQQRAVTLVTPVNVAILVASLLLDGTWFVPNVLRVNRHYANRLLEACTLTEEGKALMSLVHDEVLEHVRAVVVETAPLAAQLMLDIVSGTLPCPIGLRLKYASESLARVGFSPITRSISQSMSTTVTAAELEVLKQRAMAAREALEIAQQDILVLP